MRKVEREFRLWPQLKHDIQTNKKSNHINEADNCAAALRVSQVGRKSRKWIKHLCRSELSTAFTARICMKLIRVHQHYLQTFSSESHHYRPRTVEMCRNLSTSFSMALTV
jgi:hypothetical protein